MKKSCAFVYLISIQCFLRAVECTATQANLNLRSRVLSNNNYNTAPATNEGFRFGGVRDGAVLSPFGGASDKAKTSAHDLSLANANALNKKKNEASAQKQENRYDIFYQKLIVFKKSRGNSNEAAATVNKNLNAQNANQLQKRDRKAETEQQLN